MVVCFSERRAERAARRATAAGTVSSTLAASPASMHACLRVLLLTSQPCWLIPHSPSMIPTGRCPCVWSRNSGLSRRPVCITRIAITTRHGESRGARRRDRNSEGWSWTIRSVSARACGVVSARVSVGESTVLDLASFLPSFSHPLIPPSSFLLLRPLYLCPLPSAISPLNPLNPLQLCPLSSPIL